ncbi:MAG TPA: hypothetical protein VF412_16835 [Bdellovibrio sp.]|uniref:hypothetical protein n=1 Tax=Bdellovibrio sp. TaxID=28201 RepID=UPI002F1A27BB
MKSFIALVVSILSVGFSASASEISGTFIEGGSILYTQIKDDPSMFPYYGGQLWSILPGNGSHKSLKTDKFEISCDGGIRPDRNVVASCETKSLVKFLKNNPLTYSIVLTGQEAILVNAQFAQDPFSLNLRAFNGPEEAFWLDVDRMNSLFSMSIFKKFVR